MLKHRDRRRDDDPARKSARRYAVVIQVPLGYVVCLRVRDCAALLASGAWMTITTIASSKRKA